MRLPVYFFMFLAFAYQINAFGIANSYLENNTMMLAPGESRLHIIEIQNNQEEVYPIKFVLEGGIAKLVDPKEVYEVGGSNPIQQIVLNVTMPEKVKPGTVFSIRMTAYPSGSSDQPISLSVKINKEFSVVAAENMIHKPVSTSHMPSSGKNSFFPAIDLFGLLPLAIIIGATAIVFILLGRKNIQMAERAGENNAVIIKTAVKNMDVVKDKAVVKDEVSVKDKVVVKGKVSVKDKSVVKKKAVARKNLLLILLLISLLPAVSPQSQFNMSVTLVAETCLDGLQNQNETGVDCGGVCDPCPVIVPNPGDNDGGSGGGGGGSRFLYNRTIIENLTIPSVTQTEPIYLDRFHKRYLFIQPNDTIEETLNYSDIPVIFFSMKVSRNLAHVVIDISNYEDGAFLTRPDHEVFRYFKISVDNVLLSDIEQMRMILRIPTSWIAEMGSIEQLKLLNYQGYWKVTDVSFLSDDGEYAYFDVTTDTVGIFAIAGKPLGKVDVIKPEPKKSFVSRFMENPSIIFTEKSTSREKALMFISSATLITVLMGFGVYLFEKRRSRI